MPAYIVLCQFTEQGVRTVKETTKRADAFKAMAKKAGATVKDLYWTLGQYDLVAVMEAPDDVSATAVLLSVGSLGNIRTQALRAFSAEEMGRVLGKMA
jgi:uncharacterized protein with GYD domain